MTETSTITYPYEPVEVKWKRPPIDRDVLKACTERSDLQGWFHCLGVLGVLATTGWLSWYFFTARRWGLMALALYLHGGLFAFYPQMHEFSHGTIFRTKWLNSFFKRLFGVLHWRGNGALYRLSHMYHHRFTLHRKSEGEEVHPRAETVEQLLQRAVIVADPIGLITAVYGQIYSLFKPFLRNPKYGVWQRYVYAQASVAEQRDVDWTGLSQFLFHVLFGAVAIATGHWFLIVVVSLPSFYGGTWYHMWVHDTMHVGREPETDDFRLCCRTVRLDPFTSFMYWHMEWHVEHHAYAGIPCYNLKKFHKLTRTHWDRPQSLVEAWREMNSHSEKLLAIPPKVPAGGQVDRHDETETRTELTELTEPAR